MSTRTLIYEGEVLADMLTRVYRLGVNLGLLAALQKDFTDLNISDIKEFWDREVFSEEKEQGTAGVQTAFDYVDGIIRALIIDHPTARVETPDAEVIDSPD